MDDAFRQREQKQLYLNFENMQNAVFSKLVKKVGDRRYWEQWAADVADIAERHITQIRKLISEEGSQAQKAFQRYVKGLRKNINPSVSDDDAIEMLAQHFITQPVFEALFQDYSFVQNNAVSKSMQGMVKILNEQTPKEDNEKLERFYESVRERAKDIDNAEGKQKVIVELYDKFFKTAFPKTVEKLGIVYTPVEVVDFIINSVEDVMKKEFGRSLSDENVHILDPFTGTGTFIVRLLQSGIIKPEDMARKYKNELHACEIVLLAYYIASINIENTYHDFLARRKEEEALYEFPKYEIPEGLSAVAEEVSLSEDIKYEPFEGICMTDTFQMGEDSNELLEDVFPQNSKRVNKLKNTPITVIIGNPPYSRQQKSANDDAENQHYPKLENAIAEAYGKNVNGSSIAALYDSYIKAFKWSEDRIKENGIIAFITNSGYLTSNSMEGLRRNWERTFSKIYIVNLRGASRGLSKEAANREGGNVFDIRSGVCITVLVKKKNIDKAELRYYEVPDYLKKEEKLSFLKKANNCFSNEIKYKKIEIQNCGEWLKKRSKSFSNFIPIQSDKKGNLNSQSYFSTYSLGLNSNRDSWVYGFSTKQVLLNCERMIMNFNREVEEHKKDSLYKPNKDKTYIAWSSSLDSSFQKNEMMKFEKESVSKAIYRPFIKEWLYHGALCIHRPGLWKKIFPTIDTNNIVICTPGAVNRRDYSVLIASSISDLNIFDGGTQCFPLFWYEEVSLNQLDLFSEEKAQFVRHDSVTDFILDQAQQKYGPRVTKKDIFYYVYGILHSKSYIKKFADDLKMQLPRLPLVSEPQKFWDFSKAGRKLADLHLNYESVPAHPDVIVEGDKGNYQVTKMQPNRGKSDTIIYNDDITIKNIPMKAYDYVVNGKSAIEWIKERYQIKPDKDSGITNDPNDWGKEHGNSRYILDLLLSVINVSCQTVDIVNSLPEVDWDKE